MIRAATPSDADGIERLWLALTDEMQAADHRFQRADDALIRWRNDMPHWITAPAHGVWVADLNGHVVGFADAELSRPAPLYVQRRAVHINHVYVEPAHRRQGQARALVSAIQAWGVQHNAQHMQWQMLSANDDGRGFWTAVGGKSFTETWTVSLSPQQPLKADDTRPHPLGFH